MEARARGRPPQHRGAPDGTRRAGGKAPAHRPQPQRPGRHRRAPVAALGNRHAGPAAGGHAACAGGAGGGTPTNDPIEQPKEQVQQVLTSKNGKTSVKTGSSNKTNGNNPNNQASTSVQGNNPFGSGGSGNGNGAGNGPFGGPGDGEFGDGPSGAGDGKARTRLNDATLPSYDTDFDSKIHLKLSINSNGDVFAATCIKSKSTCTDQRIINQVIAEVMKQVKYKKDPGSGTVYAFYTVQIDAK